jgi:hypothetical protein
MTTVVHVAPLLAGYDDVIRPPARARRHTAETMRAFWSVAAVAVMSILVGCSQDNGGRDGEGVSLQVDGFRAHRSTGTPGLDAIVAGVVEADPAAGCVWLSNANGARYPVVWPSGPSASPDPLEIVLADGRPVRSGDWVEGSGGYVAAEAATSSLGLDPFPAACVHVGEAAVFNAASPMSVVPASRSVGLVGNRRLRSDSP